MYLKYLHPLEEEHRMKLSEILTPGLIFTNIKASEKSSCLNEIVKNICNFETQLNPDLTLRLILNREKLCSTALDNNIAIPHAKIPGLTRSHCGLAVNKKGIDFDSVDGELTKIIIVLLHPEADSKNHLLILKNIATLFSDKKIVNEIIQSNESYDIYRLIQSYEKK